MGAPGRGAAAGSGGAAGRHAAPAGPAGRAASCPRATCGRCAGSGTGRACARSTGRWPARFRGQREACRETVTVHLGGTLAEVAASEAEVAAGRHPERPFCLVAQPGVVDPGRAPAGGHVLWGYCHVPSGSDGRHVRADRGPDRALRARLPRPGPGPVRAHGRGPGALQPELRGRRHQRRGGHAAPDAAAPGAAVEPLPHARPRPVPVLGLDPAGRRGARHVRLLGRPHRPARPRPGRTRAGPSSPRRPRRWPCPPRRAGRPARPRTSARPPARRSPRRCASGRRGWPRRRR